LDQLGHNITCDDIVCAITHLVFFVVAVVLSGVVASRVSLIAVRSGRWRQKTEQDADEDGDEIHDVAQLVVNRRKIWTQRCGHTNPQKRTETLISIHAD
jgi:archaellum component FlaG (FlaF/FlaG flagellin family)